MHAARSVRFRRLGRMSGHGRAAEAGLERFFFLDDADRLLADKRR